MGSYTDNLGLYKVNTETDGNDTFNIETMLNDNWDKIDEKLEKLPIQNGGLYINSETTEEDKAEAVEAIKEIGLSASDVGALPNNQPVPIDKGGTGATTAAAARTNLGAASATDLANYLLLTGGTMTGTLNCTNSEGKTGAVYGKHNRPTGSYKGNGSATTQQIDMGVDCDSSLIIIGSTGYLVLASHVGAMVITGSSATFLDTTHIKFANGILQIKSTEESINRLNQTYEYQVL